MWQLRCITTWGRPTSRKSLSALITTPVSSSKSLNLSVAVFTLCFTADTLRYAVTLTYDYVTLTFHFWLWTFVVYRLHRGQTLYRISAKSSRPRRSYCDLNIWRKDLEHVMHVAISSRIIFTEFELGQPILTWLMVFFATGTLCCAVTLTYNLLILKVL